MIAQDTGSAPSSGRRAPISISAPATRPRSIAGRLRHHGRFVMLVPRELDPVEAGAARCRCRCRGRPIAGIADGRAVRAEAAAVRDSPSESRRAFAACRAPVPMTPPRPNMPGRGRRRELSDEERALWRDVTRSVRPLRQPRKASRWSACESQRCRRDRRRAKRQGRGQAVAVAGASTSPARRPPPLAPLGRRAKQKLARGRTAIDARIDLHGMTQARGACARWCASCAARSTTAPVVLVDHRQGVARDDAHGERGVLAARCRCGCGCRSCARRDRLRGRPRRPRRRGRALCAAAAVARDARNRR